MFYTRELNRKKQLGRKLTPEEQKWLEDNRDSLNPRPHAYSEGKEGECFYCGNTPDTHKSRVVVVDGNRTVEKS